jgi:hypothetical protein
MRSIGLAPFPRDAGEAVGFLVRQIDKDRLSKLDRLRGGSYGSRLHRAA